MQVLAKAVHREGLKKMNIRERKAIEEKVAILKDQLTAPPKNPDDAYDRPNPAALQDPIKIKADIKRLEELLNKDEDLVAKGGEKDILVKKLKELCAIIKKEMLTPRQEALKPTNSQDYNAAVNQQVAHQRAYQRHIEEAQEIGKRLEPLDPQAGNIKVLVKKYA